jgi:hypothetical protein
MVDVFAHFAFFFYLMVELVKIVLLEILNVTMAHQVYRSINKDGC